VNLSIRKRLILAAITSIATLFALAAPASAATSSADAVPFWHWEYRAIDKTYHGEFSGDWKHCVYVTQARYTQSVSCSSGVSVSTTYSGSISIPLDYITETLGFSISYSRTVSSSISVSVKKGGSGWYDMGFRYKEYSVVEQRRYCAGTECPFPWGDHGEITAQYVLGSTYHYFGTGAA
jgi:hypothetical protein